MLERFEYTVLTILIVMAVVGWAVVAYGVAQLVAK